MKLVERYQSALVIEPLLELPLLGVISQIHLEIRDRWTNRADAS